MSTLSKTTTVSMWFAPVKSTYAVAASPRTPRREQRVEVVRERREPARHVEQRAHAGARPAATRVVAERGEQLGRQSLPRRVDEGDVGADGVVEALLRRADGVRDAVARVGGQQRARCLERLARRVDVRAAHERGVRREREAEDADAGVPLDDARAGRHGRPQLGDDFVKAVEVGLAENKRRQHKLRVRRRVPLDQAAGEPSGAGGRCVQQPPRARRITQDVVEGRRVEVHPE